MKQAKVIAVAGPECTGKSQLTLELAKALDALPVSELARAFMAKKNLPLSWDDFCALYRLQLEAWKKSLSYPGWVIWDTDGFNGMLWAKLGYGKTLPALDAFWTQKPWDLALICAPDIPWEPDPLREGPDQRAQRFNLYLQHYQQSGLPWKTVQGLGEIRLKMALEAVLASGLTPKIYSTKGSEQ